MNGYIHALRAELLKHKHSNILWVTFLAFALGPIMGGVFLYMMRISGAAGNAGALHAKAQMVNFAPNWDSYLGVLTQVIGVGGVLIFGFVASWIFGREYSEGTAKDLLALPVSRARILNVKFFVYAAWCMALVTSNLVIGFLIGSGMQIAASEHFSLASHLQNYLITTGLTMLLGTPIAFFALWGKGYLVPLGFVALTLVFAQIVAAIGFGYYFPWAIPGLYSGASGEYKSQLDIASYAFLMLTSLAGYFATLYYWKYTDHTK